MNPSIFEVLDNLRSFGVWYCLWRGYSPWAIFVASRMNKHTYN